MHHLDSAV